MRDQRTPKDVCGEASNPQLIKGLEIVSVVNALSSPVAVYKLSQFYSSIMP